VALAMHRTRVLVLAAAVAISCSIYLQFHLFAPLQPQQQQQLLGGEGPKHVPAPPPILDPPRFEERHEDWVVMWAAGSSPGLHARTLTLARNLNWWVLVVCPHARSPAWEEWDSLPGTFFLGPDELARLPFETARMDPGGVAAEAWSGWAKNLGYLFAIHHGALRVYDTEDGPVAATEFLQAAFLSSHPFPLRLTSSSDPAGNRPLPFAALNHLSLFGIPPGLVPRGIPIGAVEASPAQLERVEPASCVDMLIQHSPCDRHPDAVPSGGQIDVSLRDIQPFYVPRGILAALNSRSTMWHRGSFALLWMPRTRASPLADVWRGYVAQRLLWEIGGVVGFVRPVAVSNASAFETVASADHQQLSLEFLAALGNWKPIQAHLLGDQLLHLASFLEQAGFWLAEDLILIGAWLRDLGRIGYTSCVGQFCSNYSATPQSEYADIPFVVNQPKSLVYHAVTSTTNVRTCCTGPSVTRWNLSDAFPLMTGPFWSLDELLASEIEGGTTIIDLLTIPESIWQQILSRTSRDSYVIFFHSRSTFIPLTCANQMVLNRMLKFAQELENFLALHREWEIEWEPLIPGYMSFPSPWILKRSSTDIISSLGYITERQFPATCDEEKIWFQSYYHRVGIGGFAYAIDVISGDLLKSLEWHNVIFDFSRSEWPTFFGKLEYMEWEGERICNESTLGCVVLPYSNCSAQNPLRTVDQRIEANRVSLQETLIGTLTHRASPPTGIQVMHWFYRLRRFFRNEIRTVLETLQIPQVPISAIIIEVD
jgi:hypothetical protein